MGLFDFEVGEPSITPKPGSWKPDHPTRPKITKISLINGHGNDRLKMNFNQNFHQRNPYFKATDVE